MIKRPLKPEQIKLIQTAVRAAGLRTGAHESRYRLLLSQYKGKGGAPCQSCKDLNQHHIDDLLAICEGLGWRHPGKPDDFYRTRTRKETDSHWATPGQVEAIKHLSGDLGWTVENLNGMIRRMTRNEAAGLATLTRSDGYVIIEALKAMLGRKDGTHYATLADAEAAYADPKPNDGIPF